MEVDLILGEPRAEDRYLLCSDGLTNMVPNEEITSIMAQDDEPARNVRALVEAAKEAGAKDNITAIVIEVEAMRSEKRSAVAS